MGFISFIAGIAMCIYGHVENKDPIAVMENLQKGGGGKPGGSRASAAAAEAGQAHCRCHQRSKSLSAGTQHAKR